jgi:outer membrane protein assembly factor BamB
LCLDAATGKQLWTVDYAAPPYGRKATGDEGMYRGPSSTPSFDAATQFLYTLSLDGQLCCWNTKEEGKQVWQLNLYDKYDPPQRPKVGRSGQRDYGYTTSPLVHGDWVIVEVGGKEGNLMAFDKRTGQRRWASENKDPAGHAAALVPMTVAGVPCVAVQTHNHLLVARIDRGQEGKTVAAYPWQTEFANSIATPAVQENFVVITSSYNHDTICKLEITLQGAKKIWETEHASGVCSPIIHEGHVYWAWHKVHCLDFATGKPKWIGPENLSDPGSCLITSDDRLIAWCDRGTLVLMETAKRSPDKPTVLFRRDNFLHADAWPHIVLAEGRLFCKDRAGNMKCFAVGK